MERIPRLRQPMGRQKGSLRPTTHQRLPPMTSTSPSTFQSIKRTYPSPSKTTMARNKHNTRPYKKRGLVPRFHLPTRIMASSHLDPSSLLHPHSPVPSPPLTPAPEPKEDRILFLPRPPYSIINNPHFHHDVSKSITSYMVRYLNRPQEENFIKAYYQLSSFTITPTNIFANYSKECAAWWYV